MTTTYRFGFLLTPLALLPLLLCALSFGQGLEDRLSQSRQLQAQQMMGVDQRTMDSLLAERRRQAGQQGPAGLSAPGDRAEEAVLDSMIAGPQGYRDPEYAGASTDTLPDSIAIDSLGNRVRIPRRAKVPKRYEQRIFQNVDKSAFSGTASAVGRSYVLRPGDNVIVSLWGDKERQYNLVLNSEGQVFLEGVGLVPVSGLNLEQGEARLKERLARIYSGINRGTAFVNLSMSQSGPIRVFVLGEMKTPGGYVFSGNSSILSVMYYAGGPTDIGTVRNLVLNRSGNKIPLDLYSYLIRGETLTPDILQDGDILFSGRAEALVEIKGDVGRPATYEMKKGEGVKELLEFAGGLNATAATQKMTLQRIFPSGKIDYIDLPPPREFLTGTATVELQDGDKILVEKSTEPSKDFITVTGPVKYPGTYASESIRTVQQLVEKAGGLREDAFLGRVHVVRFNPDGSSQLFAYSLEETEVDSIQLAPRDNVLLYSTKDMYLPDSVEIAGAVFVPGKFEYREGMTVKDLVMQAGGYLPHHERGKALVFRGGEREAKVEQLDLEIEYGLGRSGDHYPLQPKDLVHIPVDPRYYKKEIVSLEGLFMRPGKYALLYPGEKMSSVIQRAGGFKESAYIDGGRFYRAKDSIGRVGVDFATALKRPNRKTNISLVGGDSLYIPERSNTVKVIGEVGFETSVLYKEGASVRYYIGRAGGFTERSRKGSIVIEYANGETAENGMWVRSPDAGSVIFVPQGPEPVPIDWMGGMNAIVGTLSASAALILSILIIQERI